MVETDNYLDDWRYMDIKREEHGLGPGYKIPPPFPFPVKMNPREITDEFGKRGELAFYNHIYLKIKPQVIKAMEKIMQYNGIDAELILNNREKIEVKTRKAECLNRWHDILFEMYHVYYNGNEYPGWWKIIKAKILIYQYMTDTDEIVKVFAIFVEPMKTWWRDVDAENKYDMPSPAHNDKYDTYNLAIPWTDLINNKLMVELKIDDEKDILLERPKKLYPIEKTLDDFGCDNDGKD